MDTAAPLAAGVALLWALWPVSVNASPWGPLDLAVDALWTAPHAIWGPVAAWLGLSLLLHAAFEATGHATPGQRLMGLRLVDGAGAPAGAGPALIHAALRLLSTALVGGGHLWALADPGRQTLHDRLCGLRLVHDRRDLA